MVLVRDAAVPFHPVVGIAADVRQPLSMDPRAESILYLSYQQFPWPFMTLLVDPAAAPGAAIVAVREELARIDPSQAIGSTEVLEKLQTQWLGQPRLQTTIISVFGLATLLLTLVGLYARVAHDVAMRTREFAIRLRFIEGALLEKIAISLQSLAGNGASFCDGLHRRFGPWRYVD